MTNSKTELIPSKQEIANTIERYNFTIRTLDKLVSAMEVEHVNNNHWYTFIEKIGRKFVIQAYSLGHIFSDEIYLIKDGNSKRFIDISTIFTLLRLQLETFAVSNHLFAASCQIDERRLRFCLWQIDGLKTRQNFSRTDNDPELIEKLKKEVLYIQELENNIKSNDYFKALDKKHQDYLLKFSMWRFTNSTLLNEDKRKWKLSIDQMIKNTGVRESYFEDIYSFNSTHVHTAYFGVIQIDGTEEADKIITEHYSIMQATFITCFFIKDLCRMYQTPKNIFNQLSENERKVIESFNANGRN